MKKIIKLTEEIIPLSSKQAFFLFIIISCFFQFVLFYTPALAEDAVNNASKGEEMIIMTNTSKSDSLFPIKEVANNNSLSSSPIDISKKINNSQIIDSLFKNETEDEFLSKKIAFVVEEPKEPEIRVVSSAVHTMTAYNSEAGQTDDSPCITANGFDVCTHGIEDTVAANFLPFGTLVRIPDLFGDRIFVVRDRMNKRYSDRMDVWMLQRSQALKFGVRRTRIEIVEVIEPKEIEKEKKNLVSLL